MTVHIVGSVHGHDGADAIRVEADQIVEIGSAARMAGTRIEHGDGVVLPGLKDSHIHPVGMAAAGGQLDLSDAASIDEVVERITSRVAGSQPGTPIIATGLDDERLAEARMPTASELDGATRDRPLLVYRHCSHVAIANSVALAIGGLDEVSTDPPGGRLGRMADGSLSGRLEEAAIGLVSGPLGSRTQAPDSTSIADVLHRLRRRGITAVDAMVGAGSSMWCAGADELQTMLSLGADAPVEINVYVICETPDQLRSAAAALEMSGPNIRFAGWKGFADGSLGARTAALRAPYADDPSTSGLVVDANLAPMAELAVAMGGRAAIHAIGDLGVERGLELAERLGKKTVRIEHASVVDPDQVARMAAAGVLTSVQPSFAAADAPWIERRLGPERVSWAYPFASMRQAGVRMCGGSDAPIESADPFVGMRDACLPRDEGLDASAAVALYASTPLRVGAPATFVICDADPARIPMSDIADITVHEVWINGRRME